MSGQPFLLTVAGLALSVAGFAGLMAAFRRDASWTPTDLWRLRGIVRLLFLCMFLALVPVPVFALVQDEKVAVAISSLLIASVYAWEALGVLRERAASGAALWRAWLGRRPIVRRTHAIAFSRVVASRSAIRTRKPTS